MMLRLSELYKVNPETIELNKNLYEGWKNIEDIIYH